MASFIIQKTTKCKMPKYNVLTKSKVQIRKNTRPQTCHEEKQGDTGRLRSRFRRITGEELTMTAWSTQAWIQTKLTRGWGAGGVRRRNTGEGNKLKNTRNREGADRLEKQGKADCWGPQGNWKEKRTLEKGKRQNKTRKDIKIHTHI